MSKSRARKDGLRKCFWLESLSIYDTGLPVALIIKPAFSLVKSKKGMTIGVYDSSESKDNVTNKIENMRKGKRNYLFTLANFECNGELFHFIKIRCEQIAKRYEAHKITDGMSSKK